MYIYIYTHICTHILVSYISIVSVYSNLITYESIHNNNNSNNNNSNINNSNSKHGNTNNNNKNTINNHSYKT